MLLPNEHSIAFNRNTKLNHIKDMVNSPENIEQEDSTPFFVKYSNIWHFTGFEIEQRQPIMKKTWDRYSKNYE